MSDVIGAGLGAVAARSPLAYPLVFIAGLVTSVGPCAAPRYIAVAALAHQAPRPWRIIGCFAAGLIGAYVALGTATGAAASLLAASSAVYAALALALAAGAAVTLARAGGERCSARPARAAIARSNGGVVLLGAASAFVVSPCCTPVLAAIAGLTLDGGRAREGALLLAAFAAGHAAPLAAAGFMGARASSLLRRLSASQAPAIVAAGLMLALAAYYGMLA